MKEGAQPILSLSRVNKSYKGGNKVLDNLSLNVYPGEILAILGKSGSGKSTFLRIIAGLITPTDGEILYKNQPIVGPSDGVAMVFQSFALMPWLTVLENVELGLEAQGVPKKERRTRSVKAIDVVGLDGFESAYPKELSGGMRQRVGLARALVIDPDVLLMDEAFSALDVLTADNLRGDLLDLWQAGQTKLKNIIMVTHNINEAVSLADRIIILDRVPGNLRAELRVNLPHPRNEQDAAYRSLVDKIYRLMTSDGLSRSAKLKRHEIRITTKLPNVQISEMSGILEKLAEPELVGKKVDLPFIASELSLDVDDLFPITELLEILDFAHTQSGDIEITAAGLDFAQADILARKQLFARRLLKYVPLAEYIRQELDQAESHQLKADEFFRYLAYDLDEQSAQETVKTVIEWGRYAEIFAYDYNTDLLSLENPN